MSHPIKLGFYRVARAVGLFMLARSITRGRLLVLAYHGFALEDETRFRSKLFINPSTFARRLDILVKSRCQVLPLGEALDRMRTGKLTLGAVAITIDDGYATTLNLAAPLLKARGMPAMVYLTSYHMRTQTPVFDLVIAYLIWRTSHTFLQLPWPSAVQPQAFDLSSAAAKNRAVGLLLAQGHALDNEPARVQMEHALATALGVDLASTVVPEAFRLMTPEEARRLPALGVEIGLHTHRHRFPVDDLEVCRREIEDNKRFLRDEVGVDATHFCYPSGVYSNRQWEVLSQCGVLSATTCDTGMVRATDSPFGLKRFLDGESVDDIEFEAELSGFAELLRAALGVTRRAPGAHRS